MPLRLCAASGSNATKFAEHQTLVERVALEFEKSPHHPFDRPSI